MQLHKDTKLRVEDSSAQADAIAVARLVTALGQHAVAPDRFQPLVADETLAPAAGGAAASAQPAEPAQIVLGFSVP
jgi:hypothetical protein